MGQKKWLPILDEQADLLAARLHLKVNVLQARCLRNLPCHPQRVSSAMLTETLMDWRNIQCIPFMFSGTASLMSMMKFLTWRKKFA